jgi:hypothetical protein
MNLLQMETLSTDMMPGAGRISIIPNPFLPDHNEIKQCVITYLLWRYAVLISKTQYDQAILGGEQLMIPGANHTVRALDMTAIGAMFAASGDGAVLLITKQYCADGFSGAMVAQSSRVTGKSGKNTMLQGRKTIIVPMEGTVFETERVFYQEKQAVEVQPRIPELGRLLPCAELQSIMYSENPSCPCKNEQSSEEVMTHMSPDDALSYVDCIRANRTPFVSWTMLGGRLNQAAMDLVKPSERDVAVTIPSEKHEADYLKMQVDLSHFASGPMSIFPFFGKTSTGIIRLPPSLPQPFTDSLPVLLNVQANLETFRNNLSNYQFIIET